jgi:hypothetical protein
LTQSKNKGVSKALGIAVVRRSAKPLDLEGKEGTGQEFRGCSAVLTIDMDPLLSTEWTGRLPANEGGWLMDSKTLPIRVEKIGIKSR